MSVLILRGLLLTLEALAISALLPLIAWACGIFARRNAGLRHLIWLAAFGVLLALPLLALIAPPHMLWLHPAPPVPVDVAMAAPVTATYAHSWSVESLIAIAAAPLCALWLAGVLWNLSRLALGAYGLSRLRRNSIAFDHAGGCEVRLGGGPMTFGWIKPVIILPKDAPHWSRERLDAVLRHELAHIARRDSVTQWLAALACAFYWPNPLIWLGAKRLRREAEIAADDAVLAAGVQPSVYAAELVRLAADTRGAPRFAVAMASPSSLEARVTSVLSPTPSRAGVTPMDALKLGLLGSACAVALALARPDIALAQTPAPVTAAPLAAPGAAPDAPMPPAPVVAPGSKYKAHTIRRTVNNDDGMVTEDTVTVDADGKRTEHHDSHRMTEAERAQMEAAHEQAQMAREQARAARDQAREVAQGERERAHEQAQAMREQMREQMAAMKPQMEKARQQADVAREQARAMRVNAGATSTAWREASAEIRAAVHQAMEEIRPYIREASKDPQSGEKIGVKVSEAMAKVQPRIEAAIARANATRMDMPAMPPVPPLPPVHAAPPAPPAPPPPSPL